MIIKKLTLTFLGLDKFQRPVYKDSNGKLWKDIDNRKSWLGTGNENFYSCANDFEGEPDVPMSNQIIITFIPERVIAN